MKVAAMQHEDVDAGIKGRNSKDASLERKNPSCEMIWLQILGDSPLT